MGTPAGTTITSGGADIGQKNRQQNATNKGEGFDFTSSALLPGLPRQRSDDSASQQRYACSHN